jgi:hypothetical protein
VCECGEGYESFLYGLIVPSPSDVDVTYDVGPSFSESPLEEQGAGVGSGGGAGQKRGRSPPDPAIVTLTLTTIVLTP